MMHTFKFCILTLTTALSVLGRTHAAAPITIIVPFSAGGSTDILARLIAKDLGDALKTPVVVENKPGAEGFIAARQLKQANPDGYTLMLVTTSVYAINPVIFAQLPYDSAKDFVTVSVVASSPNVILASVNSRFNSLQDVLAAGHADDINYATGATMHLLNAKWLEALSGSKMTSIPYKGSAAAYPDLIAGRVDFMVDQPLSSMPFIQSGQLKVLAVTSEQRWPRLPQTPTVAEQGYPDFSTTSWWAILAPAGTPPDTLQRLHNAIAQGLSTPEMREKIAQIGADISNLSHQQSQAYTSQELSKWQAIAKVAGIKPN